MGSIKPHLFKEELKMLARLKNDLNQRPSAVVGLLILTLLALAVLIIPDDRLAEAQEPPEGPEFALATFASTDGQSTIVSQKTVLEADDFVPVGTMDKVQGTVDGLTLPEGAGSGVYLTDPIPSPLEFTTDIGPAWLAEIPDGASVTVEARLSGDGQVWNEWSQVPVEFYPTRTGEYGGSLLWVNEAELYVQFRVTLQAGAGGASPRFDHLALFFNDTSQGPSDGAVVAAGQAVDESGETCPAKPQVIPRTVWGCPPGPTSPKWPPAYHPVTHIVINHTATPNEAEDWARVVRSIWHYHAHILGWGDVGYQYLIDPLGNIYEGRAGGDDVIGAYDGFNRGSMGIGYIGCYGNCGYLGIPNVEPPTAMLEAGNDLIAWKIGQKDLDPLGEGPYCEQTLPTIVSRSDVMCRGGSLSPGDLLDARIPDIRSAVQERLDVCPTPGEPPQIDGVTPESGLVSDEILLTVTGQNFRPSEDGFLAQLRTLDGSLTFSLTLTGTVALSTEFEALIPAHVLTPGFYDLVVTNPDGQSDDLAEAYEALPDDGTGGPVITQVTPDKGLVSEEVVLLVEGSNFEPNEAGFNVELISATSGATYTLTLGSEKTDVAFEAVIAADQVTAGVYNLQVTNPDGQSDTLVDAYEAITETNGAVVRIDPASLLIGIQQTGVTSVEAADVENLFGVDLHITYNPNVVEVVDADPTEEGVQVGLGALFDGVDFLVVTNQVEDGVIDFVATRQAPSPVFSGTTSIIDITWLGQGAGQTDVVIMQADLANPDGQPLEVAVENGQIQVGTVVIITGQVELQGSSDHSGATVTNGHTQIQTGADGRFQIEVPPDQPYSLLISAPGYLSAQTEGAASAGSTAIEVGPLKLLGGDVTGDDRVNIFDLSYMGSRYGGNDPTADINRDGGVNIFDLTVTASNYGRFGPVQLELDPK
jgi:hypothetical protein